MNNYYIFISELTNSHFNKHQFNQAHNIQRSIQSQIYCHYCYPPPDGIGGSYLTFWNWIQTCGAVQNSGLTYRTFHIISQLNLEETSEAELRLLIVRLLNTILYQDCQTAHDQVYFINIVLE